MMRSFVKELEELINKHSLETHSNTPDFILANYLINCLNAFNPAVFARDKWYGKIQEPAQIERSSANGKTIEAEKSD